MEATIKDEIDKLETQFKPCEIEESYAFLKSKISKLDQTKKVLIENNISKNDIDELKKDLIKLAASLKIPSLEKSIVPYIENNTKNAYYFNIIKVVLIIIKKLNQGISIEEAKKQIYQEKFDLSGFELSIVNKVVCDFLDQENNIFAYKKIDR